MSVKDPLNFQAQLEGLKPLYQMVQVLDEQGKIVNPDLDPKFSDDELVELMSRMVFSRVLNDRSMALAKQGRLGFFAPTEGEEASQIASHYAFDKKDFLLPGYRDVPQLIFHGLPVYKAFLWSRGHVEGNDYPEDLVAMPPQIIIGAQYTQALGVGLGFHHKGEAQVAFTYTGDGGSSQGDVYEAMNFAGILKANVVFIIQNNGYAISTPREIQTAAHTLAQKAAAAGIPGIQVDGMDALGVYAVAKAAREWAIAGNGPVLIETVTSRFGPHSMSGDDPKIYRTKESFEQWAPKDPLIRMRTYLGGKGLWDDAKEKELIATYEAEIKEAVKQADHAPRQKISEFLKNVYATPSQIIQEQIEEHLKKEEGR